MRKLIIFCFLFISTSIAHAQTVHDLKGSIDIIEADMLKDGGTIGFVLKDREGKEMPFCIDGRMMTTTRNRVYINTFTPNKDKRMLESRSEEEKMVLYYLSAWLKTNIDQQTLNSLSIENIDYQNDKKKYIAFRIKQVIEILRKKQKDTCSTSSDCQVKWCCPAACLNKEWHDKRWCPEGDKIECEFSFWDPAFECTCYNGICMGVRK